MELSDTLVKSLFQSLEDIGTSLRYLVEREKKREAVAGHRLPHYENPHFSEVIDMVETILKDVGKPMSAPQLYLEMGRRGMTINSVNPGKYLSTIMDREQHKSKAKIFYARGSNPGWRLKAPVHVTVGPGVAGYTLPKQNGDFTDRILTNSAPDYSKRGVNP